MFGDNSDHWETRLKDVIIQMTNEEWIENTFKETFVTLQSKGNGAKKRKIKNGKTPIPFSGYRIRANQFIYSRIDARNGAFALVPSELDGAVVSKDFPVFDIRTELVDGIFLLHCVLQDSFIKQIQNDSFGETNRQRVKEEVMGEYHIPLPEMFLQREFARYVEHVNSMRIKTKTILILYDDLVKSRFNEMFGDPYMLPKYDRVPFMECLKFNPRKSEIKNVSDERIVSFVPMESVGTNGSIDLSKEKFLGDVRKSYTYFRDNDVLFAKITPCFENGKVAIAKNCRGGIGFGTTEFHVVRPKTGITNSTWLLYLLRSDSLRVLASGNMSGTAGQKRVQQPFFEKLSIGLPPIENRMNSQTSSNRSINRNLSDHRRHIWRYYFIPRYLL